MAPGVVLTRPDEPTRFDWAEAGVVTSGPSAALSGWEALQLHGIARTPSTAGIVLVLVRTGRSRKLGPVLIRRANRPYISRLTSIEHPILPLTPVVAPPRAVADVTILLRSIDQVRAVVAKAVQRQMCSPSDLRAELDHVARNGSRHLRIAVSEITEGARSAAEAHVLAKLRRSGLPDFELNVPVVNAAGDVIYELDVLWRHYRAAFEIEGREFHFSREEWQSTLRRHNILTGGSLAVVHYPPSTLMTSDSNWLCDLERWLRTRATELGVAYVPGSPRRGARVHNPVPWVLGPISE